ncbi:hypothetical protein [Sinomicrobium weinanense]|uniref:Uncharacterized protein n=1 Tax=Sinomicrobium weinanense TaxID=2842200 RepID=A0A926Q5E9_9FLAO|nr:hypothetical protein [Sinomicrobium weinanense]MBC9798086.1 hypothetical protein [Sinomicrobium weinanense]MBU3122552.1 hypothetical protein [Sinomicrobium weinanense]
MSTAITLESNPIEKDYEDYICAYFQSGGLYVERSIIHRETEEILELDIIFTDFKEDTTTKKLVEIKSGKWGFSEIFKVKGWLVYLKMGNGIFIVKKTRNSIDYFKRKGEELGIELIDNSDLKKTRKCLEKFLNQPTEEKEIETLRFSYLLERKLLKQIKNLKKDYPDNEGFKNLDDYFFKINSGSFFSSNPVKRIKQLFETFIKYKNVTAKICHELETEEYDDEVEELSADCFKSLFYKAENSPLQIALYVEHMARLTILKSCTEHLIENHREAFLEDTFSENLDYLGIPQTIKNGLAILVKEPFFHRYPVFWQFFTYVMGGFILTDLREQEYQYISENTGIPVEEIPNAFESFNKLFPKVDGWMFSMPKSNIEWHRFFPIPFSGVGANHRRFLHLKEMAEDDQTYEELSKLISGAKTMTDLNKWNNLGYEMLKQ